MGVNDASNESPTSHGGPRQIYCPRRVEIARFGGGAGGAGGTFYFRINCPDSRVRTKFAIIGVAKAQGTAPGSAVLAGRGITIWPYAVEDDQIKGGRGTPVSDVIPGVTESAPLAIPTHAGLGGYGRELETIADGVEVKVVIPTQDPGGTGGSLFVQTRYQPDSSAQIIPWDQWDEIRSLCDIRIYSTPIVVP